MKLDWCPPTGTDPRAHSTAATAVEVAAKRDTGTGENVMLAVRGAERSAPAWVEWGDA